MVESFQHGVPAILPILIARLKVTGRVLLYAITIVGLPWALLRIVRAIYLPQVVIFEGDSSDEAISDSAQIANVSLPRSVLTQLVLTIVTVLGGPLIAIFLLLALPSRPIALVNYVSSVMFAMLYSVGVIGMTLLYMDLRTRLSESRIQRT